MDWLKKITDSCLAWATRQPKIFRYTSYILNAFAGVVFVLWILKKKAPYFGDLELEALFACLSGSAITVNQFHRMLYERSEYSPAHVLALGYVNNFLLPAITQLKEDGEINPIICVYRPKKISELDDNSIAIMKAELINKRYTVDKIVLNLRQVRARDILIIHKDANTKLYFDFPNTLTSLISYIDYKIISNANTSVDTVKAELGEKLINEFYLQLKILLKEKRIKKNIKFCNVKLKLFP